jgi:hypothetical protein
MTNKGGNPGSVKEAESFSEKIPRQGNGNSVCMLLEELGGKVGLGHP